MNHVVELGAVIVDTRCAIEIKAGATGSNSQSGLCPLVTFSARAGNR